MNIIVASPYLNLAHAGGSIFPLSLAEALADAGYQVTALGLGPGGNDPRRSYSSRRDDPSGKISYRWLTDPVERGWGRFPMYEGFVTVPAFQNECRDALEEIRPDLIILNSLNRLANFVRAADEKQIPVMYIASDLGASCLNEIGLREEDDRRCDGPDIDKCITCQTSQFTWSRYLLSRLLRLFSPFIRSAG